ncbi:MAG: glycosyltransferase [Nitrospirae bacterium]|nr:glycosyltransferase [Nitrospirota bacterium]
MTLFESAGIFFLVLSFLGIMLPLGVNMLLVFGYSIFAVKKSISFEPTAFSVSIITVVHNGEKLVSEKIINSLSLNFPSPQYEVVIYSDGSTDRTEEAVKPFLDEHVRFYSSAGHEGKINGMNNAVEKCTGDVLVFSDADALLEKDSVAKLVRHFADPGIGGVCGQREISAEKHKLKKAQGSYIKFDSMIKLLESRSGSISSNDGKIYAVRRSLYRPIPDGVTDDLYACLSVIAQGYRFVFEPEAVAYVRVPSRSAPHEVVRRRRIVGTSLRGIWMMRELFNPFRHGIFSLSLFINKILRRLLPFSLIMLFFSTLILSFYGFAMKIFVVLQAAFYLTACIYLLFMNKLSGRGAVSKAASMIFYFCLGNYGTLRGVLDFISGRVVTKWKPLKN